MDLKRIIKILIGLVILLIVVFGVLALRQNLALNINDSMSQKNAFKDYKVDTNFKNGVFRAEIRDLVTSTGGMEKRYYRYDIIIDTEDKKSARAIKNHTDEIAVILNGIMTTFPPDKLDTDAERMRVKRLMSAKITEMYPNIKIKDLYFTNYVYN